jgi:uncharacterized membrane protein YraQ (UPF0718 family)
MKFSLVLMSVMCLVFSLLAWLKDPQLALNGLAGALRMFVRIAPILIPAFIAAGMLQEIMPKETFLRWFGQESGLRGIVLGTLAGAVMPGGPYLIFPVLAVLFKAGGGIGPIIAFVSSWSLVGINRTIVFEIPMMGWQFSVVRILAGIIFPIPLALLARFLWNRLSMGG